jgi:hypothetical protein
MNFITKWFKRNDSEMTIGEPTQFTEKVVPVDIRVTQGIHFSFAPSDGRDFRVIFDGKAWGTIPHVRLTKEDIAGVEKYLFPLVSERIATGREA